MLNVSREEALERWDNLPDSIRESLFSEENADFVDKLGEKYSLSPDAAASLLKSTSNILHGFINPKDLASELTTIPGIKPEVANQIALAIDGKIFAPIRADLESIYKPLGSTVIPVQQGLINKPQNVVEVPDITSIPTPRPKETLLKPSVTGTPFILHNEEETKPQIEAAPINASPLRPMFYKAPTNNLSETKERPMESRPIVAKLELGVETQPTQPAAPQMFRTPKEEVRQVNYSEFRTPLNNPFAGNPIKPADAKLAEPTSAPAQENKVPAPPKANVPNVNVVNLKDLPL